MCRVYFCIQDFKFLFTFILLKNVKINGAKLKKKINKEKKIKKRGKKKKKRSLRETFIYINFYFQMWNNIKKKTTDGGEVRRVSK